MRTKDDIWIEEHTEGMALSYGEIHKLDHRGLAELLQKCQNLWVEIERLPWRIRMSIELCVLKGKLAMAENDIVRLLSKTKGGKVRGRDKG